MAASRRAERRLLFKPLEHPPPEEGLPPLREDLALAVSERGNLRLTRTLTPSVQDPQRPPLSAEVTAAGEDPAVLLDQIEGFPLARQFARYEGVLVQRSYRIVPQDPRRGRRGQTWHSTLTQARARVGDVTLEIDADRSQGMPIQVRLSVPADQRLQIPQDLLSVIGRDWRPVDDYVSHWRGTIRVAKREPARTGDIEDKMRRTVTHLAETLSRPPALFHGQFRRERWRASFQRAIPLLVGVGMIAATPLVRLLPMGEGSLLRMLVFHAPPLMLIGFFVFSELPRIEIPPLPRQLRQAAWLAGKS
jgi:hypothetical protein